MNPLHAHALGQRGANGGTHSGRARQVRCCPFEPRHRTNASPGFPRPLRAISAATVFLVALVLSASVSRSIAFAAPAGDEVIEVVVTGSRVARRHSDAIVATDVITRDTLTHSGVENAAEALEEHAGVQIDRSFRGASVQLQGLQHEHVLVLVDGQRVGGRTGGSIDLSRFPVEAIERIEIVRGSASALYGSEAIGGVINIILRIPRNRKEASAHLAYGYSPPPAAPVRARDASFTSEQGHTFDAAGSGGLSAGRLRLQVHAGYHHAGSYDLEPENIATTSAASDHVQVGGKGVLKIDERIALESAARYSLRDFAGIDQNGQGAIFDREQRQEEASMSIRPRFLLDPGSLRVAATYSLFRDQLLQDQRRSSALDEYQESIEHMGQLTVQYDVFLADEHFLIAGYDTVVHVLDSPRLDGRTERGVIAPYLQHEWTILWEPRIVVAPSLRADFDSQFGSAVSPKLAVRMDATDEIAIRGSVGRGYRAPTFQELALFFENPSAGYVVQGNPRLGPETSLGAQLGLSWMILDGHLIALNAFRTDIDDLITTTTIDGGAVGRTTFTYENIESAHTQGLEASIGLRFYDGLDSTLSYTLTDTEDEHRRRPLEGRARHRATVAARLMLLDGAVAPSVRAALIGERPFFVDADGDGVEERIDRSAVALVDVRVEWRPPGLFAFGFGVDNLLDAGDAYFAVPPRSFYATMDMRWTSAADAARSGERVP